MQKSYICPKCGGSRFHGTQTVNKLIVINNGVCDVDSSVEKDYAFHSQEPINVKCDTCGRLYPKYPIEMEDYDYIVLHSSFIKDGDDNFLNRLIKEYFEAQIDIFNAKDRSEQIKYLLTRMSAKRIVDAMELI